MLTCGIGYLQHKIVFLDRGEGVDVPPIEFPAFAQSEVRPFGLSVSLGFCPDWLRLSTFSSLSPTLHDHKVVTIPGHAFVVPSLETPPPSGAQIPHISVPQRDEFSAAAMLIEMCGNVFHEIHIFSPSQ